MSAAPLRPYYRPISLARAIASSTEFTGIADAGSPG